MNEDKTPEEVLAEKKDTARTRGIGKRVNAFVYLEEDEEEGASVVVSITDFFEDEEPVVEAVVLTKGVVGKTKQTPAENRGVDGKIAKSDLKICALHQRYAIPNGKEKGLQISITYAGKTETIAIEKGKREQIDLFWGDDVELGK